MVVATCVSTSASVIGSSARQYPTASTACRHLGEGAPFAEPGSADEMGGEVAVSEAEPGLRLAVRRQLLLGVPGLVCPSPSAFGVDAPAERVHDRVEIGTDAQAEEPDVVSGVRDDAELVIGLDGVPDTGDESGASETPGQDGDAHVLIVGSGRLAEKLKHVLVLPSCDSPMPRRSPTRCTSGPSPKPPKPPATTR